LDNDTVGDEEDEEEADTEGDDEDDDEAFSKKGQANTDSPRLA
jgi:hypothetical protein